jgi:hypothetical protein
MRAAAAPRNPKNGAVVSPLNSVVVIVPPATRSGTRKREREEREGRKEGRKEHTQAKPEMRRDELSASFVFFLSSPVLLRREMT